MGFKKGSGFNAGSGGSGGGGGGGGVTQVALLSVTTAPSGEFAVGSKYFSSSTRKIYTAVTADSWENATESDAEFGTIYVYDDNGTTKYYIWDGDNLVETDLEKYQLVSNISNSYSGTSTTNYPSSKALSDGLSTTCVAVDYVADSTSNLPASLSQSQTAVVINSYGVAVAFYKGNGAGGWTAKTQPQKFGTIIFIRTGARIFVCYRYDYYSGNCYYEEAKPGPLAFTNVSASNWEADSTYNGYSYKCDLSCSGVTATMYATVTYGVDEATSGNYAPVCDTGAGTVTIYSKVNTSITIPTIIVQGV